MSKFDISGKVAIVTGGNVGIGENIARTLLQEGCSVVTCSRRDYPTPPAAEGLDDVSGRIVHTTCDVREPEQIEAVVTRAMDEFGRLDILVNNAGVLRDQMSFKMDEESWDAVVRVHLTGHFAPSRFAAEHWRAQSKAGHDAGGRIINTVSEAGLYGGTGQANYVAAKAGIAGMTIGLARELKNYGVTVNAIAPRARTRMTEAVLGDFGAPPAGDAFDEWDPENIGPVVAWLASDDAADVTGQVFVVFGGRLHLMEGWTMVGEVEQGERWTVDSIAAHKKELFGDRRTGTPRMGFGR